MDYVYVVFDKLRDITKWFASNSGNNRKREGSAINENLYSKRLKLHPSDNQPNVSVRSGQTIFRTRAEKLQTLAKANQTYAGSRYLLGIRPPQSWNFDMKENNFEFSSDEECIEVSNDDNQIMSEKSSRKPLSSSLLQNNFQSSSQDGIEILKVVTKSKTARPNGLHTKAVLHNSADMTAAPSAIKKPLSRFILPPATPRQDLSNSGGSCSRMHQAARSTPRNRPGTTRKSVTTLNMEIQLHDKYTYGALLKSVLNTPATSSSSFSSLQDLEKNLQQNSFSPPARRRNFTPKTKVDIIDLTKPKGTRRPLHLDVKPVKTKHDNDSDSDLEIVSVSPVPVPRVNSYQEKMKETIYSMPDWLQTMKDSYHNVWKETHEQARDEQIKKNLYAKQNEKALASVEERVRRHMTITETVILDEPVEEEPELPKLTPEHLKRIDAALVPHPPGAVVAEGFALRITRKDMHTLAKLNWLNDEVINFYMNLLIDRGKKEGMPKVYAFNTFFYPKLVGTGHASLKRWTRKIDVFSHDLLVVPVHLGVHWCMAIVDFRHKVVEYYDSMGHANNKCLNALLKYLEDESLDKKSKKYDTSNWKMINKKDIPQQMNGSDCGMFACTFAEYKCRNAKINFSQDDMKYFRKKMVYEILSGKLMI